MDNNQLRRLVGPILGFDYATRKFEDIKDATAHRTRMLLKGGRTRRFHTIPTVTVNSVAEHSWGVASIVWIISAGLCSADVLMAALMHDVAEVFVGDVPSPTKRALGISGDLGDIEDEILQTAGWAFNLTEQEQRWLKLADYFDGMLFCIKERALGNVGIRVVWERFKQYVLELEPHDLETTVFHTLDNEWLKVNV